ncbi:hypothetical protein FG381_11940 [Sutterella faecalis]|uniref:Phage tail tape measure protein n=1 Tax=Sutterella faecalis TaxID=2584944 RepID=A0ABX5VI26_9BURK|nr:hypothetical protein [Sutterella faecalis]QDA55584.1 hypothetical protein FG381_11940 [Sutterella faecalis]
MAGQDFRLTAILAVRDTMTPVMKQVSARWGNFRKVIDGTQFKNLQKQVALFNRSMQNVAATAGDVAGRIGGPFLALAGSLGFSLQQSVTSFASTGDALDKMSQRIGITAEQLQEFSYAATHAGAAPEDLEDALKDLGEHMAEIANGIDTSSDAFTLFQKLGIEMKDAAGNMRPVEQVFLDLADAIQRNEDPALRAKMAMATMGDSGRKLIPMLTSGSDGLKQMAAQARGLGLVMSNDAVASAATMTDHMDDMRAVIGSVGNAIGAKLAPTVIRMSDRFRDLAAANREAFSQKFASVAERLAETIEKIDFEGIASAVLTVADYAIRAFNAVGGFNTVLYAMGAIMAGKTLMSVISLGSSIISMVQTFGTLVTAARTAAVAMAGAFGPVGLVLTAVAAIAGVVIANWDRIWPALKAGASAAADFIGAVWDTVVPKFQAVFGSLLSIAKAFFQGDISGLLSGFDDLFQAAFNLLPDKWAKACLNWYEGIKKSLKSVGKMISDYFTKFDFKSLLPDWVSDLFGGSKTSGDGQPMRNPQVTPEARLSGRMNISVTASGGASAAVSDVSGSPGLDIYGQVGRSDRFVGAD